MSKVATLLALSLAIISTYHTPLVFAQGGPASSLHIEKFRYSFERSSDNHNLVQVKFRTNFPIDLSDARIATSYSNLAGSQGSLNTSPSMSIQQLPVGSIPTASEITATYEYGDSPAASITPLMDQVVVSVTAKPHTEAEAVAGEIMIDMASIRKYFDIVKTLNDTGAAAGSLAPNLQLSIVPLNNQARITVDSDAPVKLVVRAFDFNIDANTAALAAKVTSLNELWAFKGAPATVVLDLPASRTWSIRAEELLAFPGRAKADSAIVKNVHPLSTFPNVSFGNVGSVTIVQNREIHLPLDQLSNVRSLTGVIKRRDEVSGQFVSAKIDPFTTAVAAGTSKIEFTMPAIITDAGSYTLDLTAKSEFSDAPSTTISIPFTGNTPIVADVVKVEFSSKGVQFTAKTNNTKAFLVVSANADPKQRISYETVTSSIDPTQPVDIDKLKTVTGPDAGSIPLTIAVKADDGTARETVMRLTLFINKDEINNKDTKAKQQLKDIQTATTLPAGDKKAEKDVNTKSVLSTGLQTILRFLIPAIL